MASFTDQVQQYNPYIQQVPVDDYIRVGMIEQQQYDQGVQKAQSYIDSVAGLPVVGDANKQLLQRRLGELQGKLQGVMSADFRKGSLQAQIGGMASQIAKDPDIQASVYSAQQIQRTQQSIADARKTGKGYSSANEAYLNSYVEDYMNASNKTAGLSYQGPTDIHSTTEADVNKKIQDTLKELKVSADTQVRLDATGQVLITSTDKGVDQTRIKTAIQGALTADDYKALQIGGWYNTRGLSDAELVDSAARQYTTVADDYKRKKDHFTELIKNTPNLSKEEKGFYRQQEDYYDGYYKNYLDMASQVNNSIENKTFNREKIAGDAWTERLMDNYSGAFSYNEKGETVKVSPYLEAAEKQSQIILNKARAEKLLNGSDDDPTNPFGPTTGRNIAVDVNNPDNKRTFSNEGQQQQVLGIDQAVIDGRERALDAAVDNPDNDNPEAAPSEFKNPDGTWKTADARLKAAEVALNSNAQYVNRALNGGTGTIPHANRSLREATLENNILANRKALIQTQDIYAGQEAKKNLAIKGISVDPNKKVVLKDKDGKPINYTIGQLFDIYQQGTKQEDYISNNPIAGGGQKVSVRNPVEGSQYTKILDQLGEKGTLSSNQIQNALTAQGIDLKKLDEEKNRIYSGQNSVLQPFMRELPLSKKGKDSAEFDLYKKAASVASENFTVGTDTQGNDLKDLKIDSDKTDILGAYWQNGKLMMRAKVQDVKGVEHTVDVDVTQEKNNLRGGVNKQGQPTPTWMETMFVNDSLPRLTEDLQRKNSGNATLFNPKTNFAGSLFVTGKDDVARFYQIKFDTTSNKFNVVIAKPLGNGKYDYIRLGKNVPGFYGFENAGQARNYVESFYGNNPDPDKAETELQAAQNQK